LRPARPLRYILSFPSYEAVVKKSLRYREILIDARRVVIKIGSRVLVQKTGRPDRRRMRGLTADIAGIQKGGRDVVVVTSGAVGTGMEALGMKERPATLPEQQMAAAVGQCRLMTRYDELFTKLGCTIGQVLLTHDDFLHKIRLTNARRTMEHLLRRGVIPIINENDVVANEEIRADLSVSDNDYLASLVVKLIRADVLIMLTTVDGVREQGADGRSRRLRYIESVNRQIYKLVVPVKTTISSGGMETKLKAAEAVVKMGCSVIIANGRSTGILPRIMNGDDVGTMILASGL